MTRSMRQKARAVAQAHRVPRLRLQEMAGMRPSIGHPRRGISRGVPRVPRQHAPRRHAGGFLGVDGGRRGVPGRRQHIIATASSKTKRAKRSSLAATWAGVTIEAFSLQDLARVRQPLASPLGVGCSHWARRHAWRHRQAHGCGSLQLGSRTPRPTPEWWLRGAQDIADALNTRRGNSVIKEVGATGRWNLRRRRRREPSGSA